MILRTDLAIESIRDDASGMPDGIKKEEFSRGSAMVSRITIETEEGAKALQKPAGRYITIDLPSFSESSTEIDDQVQAVVSELSRLIPGQGEILVAGLGNSSITPDALGPKTAQKVFATRHIQGELARAAGLQSLRPVSVVAPGVLGQTGIETVGICGTFA